MRKERTIYLAADHGGRDIVSKIQKYLQRYGSVQVVNRPEAGDDYPPIAAALAKFVQSRPSAIGVGLCRTGTGMALVANKFARIRAVQGEHMETVRRARQDENANVITLGADVIGLSEMYRLLTVFLTTSFKRKPRYLRRLRQISSYERRV